jgi:hypothetical protein
MLLPLMGFVMFVVAITVFSAIGAAVLAAFPQLNLTIRSLLVFVAAAIPGAIVGLFLYPFVCAAAFCSPSSGGTGLLGIAGRLTTMIVIGTCSATAVSVFIQRAVANHARISRLTNPDVPSR